MIKVFSIDHDAVCVVSYSSGIRDLAIARTGSTLAASEFEHIVHIYDIRSGRKCSQFDTVMDFGGRRLAITQDGSLCAVGAYHIHGIAAYESQDGRQVWQRKDLKKVQALSLSKDGSALFAFFEVGPAHVLDVWTGVTKDKLRGVSGIVESPFTDAKFVNHNGRPEVLNQGRSVRFGPEYYVDQMFRDACFAEDCLVFGRASFPGGPRLDPSGLVVDTFCYSLVDDRVLWKHSTPRGFNVLNRGYVAERGEVLLVTWPVEGGERRLVRIDGDTGRVRAEYILRGVLARTVFAKEGTLLVTSSGDVVDTSDGHVVRVLPFPRDSRRGTLVTVDE